MAADSLGTAAGEALTHKTPKIFIRKPYIIGHAGGVRSGQIVQFCCDLPAPPKNPKDLMRFMVKDFANVIRKGLEEAGNMEKYQGTREESMAESLVGVHGHIFRLFVDFSVYESEHEFDAIGSGGAYAIGAMAVLKGSAQNRVVKAVEVSSMFAAGVRGPINYASI